jgi:hypothetical protein
MLIRLRKRRPLNGGSFSFLRLRGWDQIPRLGLTILNHQTRIAPTTTTKTIVNFIGLPIAVSFNLALNQVC